MKRFLLSYFALAVIAGTLIGAPVAGAQRRRVVVRRGPVRTRVVVRPGHPIVRPLPPAVVLRPARRTVVVAAPIRYLPALTWTAAVVTLPPRERLAWQDSETISKDEGWVDANFGIDGSGNALFLEITGKAQLNFAEITFANGNVQVVDFNEHTHDSGIYRLLDFADGRHVATARILARSKSSDTKLAVYLSK